MISWPHVEGYEKTWKSSSHGRVVQGDVVLKCTYLQVINCTIPKHIRIERPVRLGCCINSRHSLSGSWCLRSPGDPSTCNPSMTNTCRQRSSHSMLTSSPRFSRRSPELAKQFANVSFWQFGFRGHGVLNCGEVCLDALLATKPSGSRGSEASFSVCGWQTGGLRSVVILILTQIDGRTRDWRKELNHVRR